MLFHVTATHLAEDCPLYNPGLAEKRNQATQANASLAQELNLKVLYSVTGAPAHVAYHLLEADSLEAVGRWLAINPTKQTFQIVPVQHVADRRAMRQS
jgi:hypothetical protein